MPVTPFFHAFYYVMGVLLQKMPDVERIWCNVKFSLLFVLFKDYTDTKGKNFVAPNLELTK